jgi:hypothetical protein
MDLVQTASTVSTSKRKGMAVARRVISSTFDDDATELAKRSGIKSDAVFNEVHNTYEVGVFREKENLSSSRLQRKFTRTGAQADHAFIQAPAFFGETVLWYDDPHPKTYGARCLTRAELTTMTKNDVEEVVSELPYVKVTFENFKAHILQQGGTATAEQGQHSENFSSAEIPRMYEA